jgi:hypothetical protein
MLDVMRLPRGEPGEHVTLRLQILQFTVQLTDVYIVVGRLVGLHSVLQKLYLVSLFNGFLLQTLVVLSQSGNLLAKGINLSLVFFNFIIIIIIVLD